MSTTSASRRPSVKNLSMFKIVEKVIDLTNDAGEVNPNGRAKRYITEMASRLGMTPIQALMTCVFIDQCNDCRINFNDLARHFSVRPVCILQISDVINELRDMGVICLRKDNEGNITYRIPRNVVELLRQGMMPQKQPIDNLTHDELFDMIHQYLVMRGDDEIEDQHLYDGLHELFHNNMHLALVQKINLLKLSDENLVLYLLMCDIFINNHDDDIRRCDIDNHFCRRELRLHCNRLEEGTHELMQLNLVEQRCDDGQVIPTSWRLTNHSKIDILAEFHLCPNKNISAQVTRHKDIRAKELFYAPDVTRQVSSLTALLSPERMNRVQERLREKGMRTGFTCLFYGGPGTGKTETAQQMARLTGRDIMLVDVPSIRDKFVGETEKNIRAVFDRYRQACHDSEQAPILLFNEADALLNKRNESSTTAVDKMENAMQNIILQEMEQFEGIMIATTNLTSSLDAAFERRFLYKIEFPKPGPMERKPIWKAMLPELTDIDALRLAERYDFSGGQIENIARKQIIDDILSDRDGIDIEAIEQACHEEKLHKSTARAIGFSAA